MALVPCRECSGQVSTEAQQCPHCGMPSPAALLHAAAQAHPRSELLAGPADVERLLKFQIAKKSSGIAYALWFTLGLFGGHRFYVGRPGTAAIMIAVTFISLLYLTVEGMQEGFIGLGIVGIWAVVDAFRLGGWVRAHNEDLLARWRQPQHKAGDGARVGVSRNHAPRVKYKYPVVIAITCEQCGSATDVSEAARTCGNCGAEIPFATFAAAVEAAS
jgi:TM2 domain-containing membrane protein YozV